MNRLTVKSEILTDHYRLKKMCDESSEDSCEDTCALTHGCDASKECNCEGCAIQEAFDKLAAYESTGYDPEELLTMLHGSVEVTAKESDEQIHAHWYIHPDGYYPQCSHCQKEPKDGKTGKICLNCGAIMDEKKRGV